MSKTDTTSNITATKAELRKFGLLFGGILSVLFGLLLPYPFNKTFPLWPWIVSAIFFAFTVIYPRALIIAYVPWIKFGAVAGWINTRIILAILFYILITPFGLIIRLLRRDLLGRKLLPEKKSYRVVQSPQPKEHMETPY